MVGRNAAIGYYDAECVQLIEHSVESRRRLTSRRREVSQVRPHRLSLGAGQRRLEQDDAAEVREGQDGIQAGARPSVGLVHEQQ